MSWTEVRAVSFDVGGTLVTFDGGPATALIAQLLGCDLDVMRSVLGERAKRSRFEPRRLAEHIAATLGRPEEVERLDRLLRDLRTRSSGCPLYPDAVTTLAALRARGYRIYFVSNVIGTMPPLDASLARYADGVFCSSDTGHLKPERAAFAVVEEASGCVGRELVHIGDSLATDVEGALAAGWRAVLIERDPARATARIAWPTDGACVRVRSLTELLALLPAQPAAATGPG